MGTHKPIFMTQADALWAKFTKLNQNIPNLVNLSNAMNYELCWTRAKQHDNHLYGVFLKLSVRLGAER